MPLEMQTPLSALSGVGPKRAAALADRGIATVGDLLFNLPLHYQDWRSRTPLKELKPATFAVVEGRLVGFKERPMRGMRWRRMATAWLEGTGGARVRVVWFNLPAYMKGRMPDGERVVMHGRVGDAPDRGLEIIHPEVYPLDSGAPPAVRPVYGLPSEIGQRVYAGLVAQALAALGERIDGAMPAALRAEAGVMALDEALRMLHQPPADADPAKFEAGDSAAHFALAFDEMFAFQLAMGIDRMRAARRVGARMDAPATLTARLLETLPFAPTRAQLRAIDEIGADLARTHPMNRLLMGDVGSGKTLVALWAALRAAESGWQVAMMAPTELLAEQHYRSFMALGGALGVPAALLLGKTPPSERARTLRLLASGAIPVVFGTHALIQEGVALKNLGLAVIDEQHRFGVFDRARLKALGPSAHVLLDDRDADTAKPRAHAARQPGHFGARRDAAGTDAGPDRNLQRRTNRRGRRDRARGTRGRTARVLYRSADRGRRRRRRALVRGGDGQAARRGSARRFQNWHAARQDAPGG